MGRGRALLAACVALACCERAAPAPTREEPPPLESIWLGAANDDAPTVVLFHGYGAAANDLESLARELDAELGGRARFALPAAPLRLGGGSGAWWEMDPMARPLTADGPNGLPEARRLVIAWLEAMRRQRGLRAERSVLAGFSQGAVVATDVALAWDRRSAGIGALSGAMMEEWPPRIERRPLPIFVSHGRSDRVLPFADGERLSQHFTSAGATVRFVPFEGGHTIPREVVSAFAAFLRERLF